MGRKSIFLFIYGHFMAKTHPLRQFARAALASMALATAAQAASGTTVAFSEVTGHGEK